MSNLTIPWNVTFNVTNSTAGSIVGTIPHQIVVNLPWFFPVSLAASYIVFYFLLANQEGSEKFVVITFLGMIEAFLYYMFSVVGNGIPAIASAIFILTFIVYYLTKG